MANTWGESGTTWSQGDWGQQNVTTVSLTGLSITATLGDADSYPEQGWGGDAWGDEDWGGAGTTIFPTGFSITGFGLGLSFVFTATSSFFSGFSK